jgi:hypothetical protein
MTAESARRKALVGLCVMIAAPTSGALELDPRRACRLLEDRGLRTIIAYRPVSGDLYRCSSRRKGITVGERAGSSLRYYAQGSSGTVEELVLELRVGSLLGTQEVHRYLRDVAADLLHNALGKALPPAVAAGIMAGTAGQWKLESDRVELRRNSAGAPAYELILSIR